MSGANSTPLGRMNPAIGAGKKSMGISLLNPSYMSSLNHSSSSSSSHSISVKREVEENVSEDESFQDRKKKRRSRWQGDEKEKTFIPGMPTVLPSNMKKDQEEAYLLQLQIEELSRRLRSNDLGIPPNPEDRCAHSVLFVAGGRYHVTMMPQSNQRHQGKVFLFLVLSSSPLKVEQDHSFGYAPTQPSF